jgi:hypothetical protein
MRTRTREANGRTVHPEAEHPPAELPAAEPRPVLAVALPVSPQAVKSGVAAVVIVGFFAAAYAGGVFGLWACFCCGVIGFALGAGRGLRL